jgi:hypothetical protein
MPTIAGNSQNTGKDYLLPSSKLLNKERGPVIDGWWSLILIFAAGGGNANGKTMEKVCDGRPYAARRGMEVGMGHTKWSPGGHNMLPTGRHSLNQYVWAGFPVWIPTSDMGKL